MRCAARWSGCIGAGASAVDNAAEALEHGAARVAMLVRRAGHAAHQQGHGHRQRGLLGRLSCAHRCAEMVDRELHRRAGGAAAARLDAARVAPQEFLDHLANCAALGVEIKDGRVLLNTTRGRLGFRLPHPGDRADGRLVAAPGIRRAEAACRSSGAITSCRRGTANTRRPTIPIVGPAFEFLERTPGTAPWVSRIHCFTFPAYLSHGPISGDIPAISTGARAGRERRRERAVRRGL